MPCGRFQGVVARRPAVAAAVLFILGISLHGHVAVGPLGWLVLLLVLVVASVLWIRRGQVASVLLAAGVLVGGIVAGQLASFYYPSDDISAFVGEEPRLGWVEGTITVAPRIVEGAQRGRKLPDKQQLLLRVTAVRGWNGWLGADGQVPVVLSPAREDLRAGQTLRVLGRLERPAPAMNPGSFDAARYQRRQRVLVTMHVSRPYDVQIISTAQRAWTPWRNVRESARRVLEAGFEPAQGPDRALLAALVFGDREPALRGVQDDFVRSGTTHLLASNGARVAMLAGLVYLLLRLVRVPPKWSVLVVTACVAGFGLLTMPVSQAVRPVLVCAAVGIGLAGRRPVDALQLLAIAAVAVLLTQPLDLYGAGFQFSFLIVLGLLIFTRPVLRFVATFDDADLRLAKSFAPQSAWQRRRDWVRRRLVQVAVVNGIAWLIVIPLAAYHFEQLNPWTIPFGLMLAPLAMLALGAGFAKIALTALCPPLAHGWAGASGAAAELLRVAVHTLARAPGADLPFPQPSVWLILLFYGLMCLPLLAWPWRGARWCARSAPALGCAAFMLLPWCAGFAPQSTSPSDLKLTLLSVGAGQCAVIEPADGGAVLVDAGSSSSADVFDRTIEPFLRHEGRWSVDSVWLSHGDFDHISAVRQLVPEYGVRQVLAGPYFRSHAVESRQCQSLLEMLDRTHHAPRLVRAGDHVRVAGQIEIEVLWPPKDCAMNSNNAGLVLRLTCGGRSILFPADIQEPAERELLKHPERLRCDILVAPHHGSGEPTTAEFVRAADPKVILSSNDWRLTSKQRIFEQEIQRRPLYRTGCCGAITVTICRDGSMAIAPYARGDSMRIPPWSDDEAPRDRS